MTEEAKKHPAFDRLLQAAREQLNNQAANNKTLSDLLQHSEQVITNWGTRGVSVEGALKAQDALGISANWVLKGTQPKWIGADALSAGEPTKKLIGHSDENNTASSLLLRLTGILESLTPTGRRAAALMVSEAIADPKLAPSIAATLDGLLGSATEASDVPTAIPGGKSVRDTVLDMKQTPNARPKSSTNRRKSGN